MTAIVVLWSLIGMLVLLTSVYVAVAVTAGEARREDSAEFGADEGRWPDRWNTWEDDRF